MTDDSIQSDVKGGSIIQSTADWDGRNQMPLDEGEVLSGHGHQVESKQSKAQTMGKGGGDSLSRPDKRLENRSQELEISHSTQKETDGQGHDAFGHKIDAKLSTPIIGPIQYSRVVSGKWPDITLTAKVKAPVHGAIYKVVKEHSVPNYLGARVRIPSGLKIEKWREYLEDYEDRQICDFLAYGWPINYTREKIPKTTNVNHKSALDHKEHIEAFITKECALGAMIGPFSEPPFQPWCQISPLLTRPKKESNKRRVIIDLSFPEGEGVNAGIIKNTYEGEVLTYTLPTVLNMCQGIAKAGRGALLWKCDLERAYRQLRIDPLAYPLLGIRHDGQYYIDICPSFGCRVSGGSQQRVSGAVAHIMHKKGYNTLVYVDDFAGVHRSPEHAINGYNEFQKLCADLGLKLAEEKSVPPTTKMEWLGFLFDTKKMTVQIPESKLTEILEETKSWEGKRTAGRRELQSLAGKLAHVSSCIKHSRKFMTRILYQLRQTPEKGRAFLMDETRRDIAWFGRCARSLNSKQIIMTDRPVIDIECDACPEGVGGGFSRGQYYDITFPDSWSEVYHIAQIEALNLIIAVKSLLPEVKTGHLLRVTTDNSASAVVLMTGRTHDRVLAACSRELAMIAIKHQLELEVRHAPGASLILADALSRRYEDQQMNELAGRLIKEKGLRRVTHTPLDDILDNCL